jgi:hypothetical protein
MTRTTARYGFRVVDGTSGERRLVEAAAAFAGHCAADPKAEPARESYLSAFRFGEEFRAHIVSHRTTKGYAGACWSPWVWFDVDREAPALALDAAKGLATYTLMAFREFGEDDLLYFFSGSKGYHLGVPLTHAPPPSSTFNVVCRAVAERIAAERQVGIDAGIYDKVRLLRAPNSRHPKTGLHKVRLTYAELLGLTHTRVAELARTPLPFDPPDVRVIPPLLVDYWQEAEVRASEKAPTKAAAGRLSRATLDFIRDGAEEGERHVRLFRAAANLREFVAPAELVHALLTEAALDSGLSPCEVRRQIDCGIAHADQQTGKGGGA